MDDHILAFNFHFFIEKFLIEDFFVFLQIE